MSLDATTLHDVARSPRRQAILRALDEHGYRTVYELAADSAVAEAGVASSAHQQVATGLHHIHLPKLEEVDLVVWDREDGTVEPTEQTQTAAAALDAVEAVLGEDA